VLDKNAIEIEDRLKPMFIKALGDQTFGLRITMYQFMVMPMVQTQIGPRPGWGVYYQAKSMLIGSELVGQLSATTNPEATQEDVNEAVREGAVELRNNLNEQNAMGNGKGLKP
jgi:hypothetical protein